MFLFLFKPRLPCDLFRKKKCVGVGVGWGGVGAGGRSEGGGVATFFLFTQISTPDTPPRPPPPTPSCLAPAAGPGSVAGLARRVPCWAAGPPAPWARTPHGLWGAPSPSCPQGRARAAAAPVQVPSGLLTLHTLTHIPRPSTLSLTLSAHTPPPSRPRPGRRPPQP